MILILFKSFNLQHKLHFYPAPVVLVFADSWELSTVIWIPIFNVFCCFFCVCYMESSCVILQCMKTAISIKFDGLIDVETLVKSKYIVSFVMKLWGIHIQLRKKISLCYLQVKIDHPNCSYTFSFILFFFHMRIYLWRQNKFSEMHTIVYISSICGWMFHYVCVLYKSVAFLQCTVLCCWGQGADSELHMGQRQKKKKTRVCYSAAITPTQLWIQKKWHACMMEKWA